MHRVILVAIVLFVAWPRPVQGAVILSVIERPSGITAPATPVTLIEREYRLENEDWAPLLSSMCKCTVSATRGSYSYGLKPSKDSRTEPGLVAFTGPLGVLGPGRLLAGGYAFSFLGGQLILAVSNDRSQTLWDIAVDELRRNRLGITEGAVDLLWITVSDDGSAVSAMDASERSGRNMSRATRLLVTEAASLAMNEGAVRIDEATVVKTVKQTCIVPIYPFCRKKLK